MTSLELATTKSPKKEKSRKKRQIDENFNPNVSLKRCAGTETLFGADPQRTANHAQRYDQDLGTKDKTRVETPLQKFAHFVLNPNIPPPTFENMFHGLRFGGRDESLESSTESSQASEAPDNSVPPSNFPDPQAVESSNNFQIAQQKPVTVVKQAKNEIQNTPKCRCNPDDLDDLFFKISQIYEKAGNEVDNLIIEFRRKNNCNVDCSNINRVKSDPYLSRICHLDHKNDRDDHIISEPEPEPQPENHGHHVSFDNFINLMKDSGPNRQTLGSVNREVSPLLGNPNEEKNHHENRDNLAKAVLDFIKNYNEAPIDVLPVEHQIGISGDEDVVVEPTEPPRIHQRPIFDLFPKLFTV